MKNKLKCVMLIDDDKNDNFFHEREIKKTNPAITVIEKRTVLSALEYLKSNKANPEMIPDLIFLDINMPGMNGWDFLNEFEQLDKEFQSKIIIVMLTTSDNDDDVARVKAYRFVRDYITKPLTKEIMKDIIKQYFEE
jgi:response regulator RpfG family c-di-GMP phosphodiesterase